jgi:hypothetical protein
VILVDVVRLFRVRLHLVFDLSSENIVMESLPIENRRGFELNDYPTSFSIVLVKSRMSEVSRALAEFMKTSVIQDVYINFEQVNDANFTLLWQYAGHTWSTFRLDGACKQEVPRTLSENMKTDCIYFQYEDTSDWKGYELFRNGISLEAYDFGLDYREEIAELFEEMEEEMPVDSNNGISWDIDTTDDDDYYQFLFRSSLRSVSEDKVKNPQVFINDFFVSQDAWVPDWKNMPWVEEKSPPEMPKSLFVGVDFVEAF